MTGSSSQLWLCARSAKLMIIEGTGQELFKAAVDVAAPKARLEAAPFQNYTVIDFFSSPHGMTDGLLGPEHCFRCAHVVVSVIDADHDHVLGGRIFARLGRNLEVVVLALCVGELPHRLNISPLAGVQRIFGTLDGRESVGGAEVDVNLPSLERGSEVFDSRRSGINFKAAAYFFRSQRLARRMRWRVGGHDFYR